MGSERRKYPRLKCVNSIELRAHGDEAPIWGKATDLSLGGCFIEMPIPLKEAAKTPNLSFGSKRPKSGSPQKLPAAGQVSGLEFNSRKFPKGNVARLKDYLKSMTRIPM